MSADGVHRRFGVVGQKKGADVFGSHLVACLVHLGAIHIRAENIRSRAAAHRIRNAHCDRRHFDEYGQLQPRWQREKKQTHN